MPPDVGTLGKKILCCMLKNEDDRRNAFCRKQLRKRKESNITNIMSAKRGERRKD